MCHVLCHSSSSSSAVLPQLLPPSNCSCPSSWQSLLYSLVSHILVPLSFLPLTIVLLSLSWPPSSFKYFTHIYNYKHTHIHMCMCAYICVHNIYYIVWGCVYMCLYMHIWICVVWFKIHFLHMRANVVLVFLSLTYFAPPISSSTHFPTNVITFRWLWITLSTQWLISGSSSVHSI